MKKFSFVLASILAILSFVILGMYFSNNLEATGSRLVTYFKENLNYSGNYIGGFEYIEFLHGKADKWDLFGIDGGMEDYAGNMPVLTGDASVGAQAIEFNIEDPQGHSILIAGEDTFESLEDNTTYTLRVDAKGPGSLDIILIYMIEGGENEGSYIWNVTDGEWQENESFPMALFDSDNQWSISTIAEYKEFESQSIPTPGLLNPNGMMAMYVLGGDTGVKVDNFRLFEENNPGNSNMINNGDFSEGDYILGASGWNLGWNDVVVGDAYEGDYSVKLNTNTPIKSELIDISSDSNISFYHKGESIKLTLWAGETEPADLLLIKGTATNTNYNEGSNDIVDSNDGYWEGMMGVVGDTFRWTSGDHQGEEGTLTMFNKSPGGDLYLDVDKDFPYMDEGDEFEIVKKDSDIGLDKIYNWDTKEWVDYIDTQYSKTFSGQAEWTKEIKEGISVPPNENLLLEFERKGELGEVYLDKASILTEEKVNLPFKFGDTNTNLSEILNLENTEERFLLSSSFGSISFPEGLNLMASIEQLLQLENSVGINFNQEEEVFRIKVDTNILSFLKGIPALITLDGFSEKLGVTTMDSNNFKDYLDISILDGDVEVEDVAEYFDWDKVKYDEDKDKLTLPVNHFTEYIVGLTEGVSKDSLPETGSSIIILFSLSIISLSGYFLLKRYKYIS